MIKFIFRVVHSISFFLLIVMGILGISVSLSFGRGSFETRFYCVVQGGACDSLAFTSRVLGLQVSATLPRLRRC